MTTEETIDHALAEFRAAPDTGDGAHDSLLPTDQHEAAVDLRMAADDLADSTRLIAPKAVIRERAKAHAVAALRFLKHCG